MMGSMRIDSRRVVAIDIARAIAIWSMFIAHTAPSGGPLRLLNLSEYLTAALFAALIGVGAALSTSDRARSGTGHRHRARSTRLPAAIIRGGVLVILGIALSLMDADVVLVLVHLGVLTVIVVPLVRLPTWAVLATGALTWVLSPILMTAGRALLPQLWAWDSPLAQPAAALMNLLFTGGYYRVSAFVLWACVGIVLARLLIVRPQTVALPRGAVVTVAGLSTLSVAGIFAVHKTGAFELAPYSGTHAELGFNAAMATAVLAGCLVLAPVLPHAFATAVGYVGQMALTHYCLQIIALAVWIRWVNPNDDSWIVLGGLIVGSCAVTAAWRSVVRHEPWNRGPVEGGTDALVALTRRTQPHRRT